MRPALPSEIVAEILQYASPRDLGVATATCQRMHAVVQQHLGKLWGGRLVRKQTHGCPSGRTCHSSVVHDGKMYSVGGMSQSTIIASVKREICVLDLVTWEWETITQGVPAVTEQSSVLWNESIFLFGGYFDGVGRRSYLYRVDLDRQRPLRAVWLPDLPNPPPPRSSHTAVMHGDNMYVFGGWDRVIPKNDLFALHLPSLTWKKLRGCTPVVEGKDEAGSAPSPRRAHSAFVCPEVPGGAMYIVGGASRAGGADVDCSMSKLHAYSFNRDEWELVETLGQHPSPRSRAGGVYHDGLYFLLGGWDRTTHFNDLFSFSPSSRFWRRIDVAMPFGVVQHSIVQHRGNLVMFGGYCSPTNMKPPRGTEGSGGHSGGAGQEAKGAKKEEKKGRKKEDEKAGGLSSKDHHSFNGSQGCTSNEVHMYHLAAGKALSDGAVVH